MWHACLSGPVLLSYVRSTWSWASHKRKKIFLSGDCGQFMSCLKNRGWWDATITRKVSWEYHYSVNTAVPYIIYGKFRFTSGNYWISEMQGHIFIYLKGFLYIIQSINIGWNTYYLCKDIVDECLPERRMKPLSARACGNLSFYVLCWHSRVGSTSFFVCARERAPLVSSRPPLCAHEAPPPSGSPPGEHG